jgi:hypothetical protein
VPTLAQMKDHANWVWANCGLGCGHHSAIPLDPVISRWGAGASADRLRASLRCTKCGKLGATLSAPSWVCATHGWQRLPLDQVPTGLRSWMARDALRGIGVGVPD